MPRPALDQPWSVAACVHVYVCKFGNPKTVLCTDFVSPDQRVTLYTYIHVA